MRGRTASVLTRLERFTVNTLSGDSAGCEIAADRGAAACAARPNLHRRTTEFLPRDRHMANTWQGDFPWQSSTTDGYEGTSPVRAFPANGRLDVDELFRAAANEPP